MIAQIVHVDPMNTPLWVLVCGYLEQALETGGGKRDWGIADIFHCAVKGEIDAWILTDVDGVFGAAVTTLNVYPLRRSIDVLLLGTDPHREDGWRICLDNLATIARSVGATMITGTGRPGWARKLGCKERRVFEYEVLP